MCGLTASLLMMLIVIEHVEVSREVLVLAAAHNLHAKYEQKKTTSELLSKMSAQPMEANKNREELFDHIH